MPRGHVSVDTLIAKGWEIADENVDLRLPSPHPGTIGHGSRMKPVEINRRTQPREWRPTFGVASRDQSPVHGTPGAYLTSCQFVYALELERKALGQQSERGWRVTALCTLARQWARTQHRAPLAERTALAYANNYWRNAAAHIERAGWEVKETDKRLIAAIAAHELMQEVK